MTTEMGKNLCESFYSKSNIDAPFFGTRFQEDE